MICLGFTNVAMTLLLIKEIGAINIEIILILSVSIATLIGMIIQSVRMNKAK
jgi:hypothetical protein